jgi:hypothetical protein
MGELGMVSGGVVDFGTYEEDSPVTWEALGENRCDRCQEAGVITAVGAAVVAAVCSCTMVLLRHPCAGPGEALHLMGCASKKSQMTVLASRLREVFPVIMAGR